MAYSVDVPPETKEYIKGSLENGPSTIGVDPVQRQSVVIIRKINDTAHPANGQMGLFAKAKINPNTWLADYLGEAHVIERDSDYDLSLCRRQTSGGEYVNVGVRADSFISHCTITNEFPMISCYI